MERWNNTPIISDKNNLIFDKDYANEWLNSNLIFVVRRHLVWENIFFVSVADEKSSILSEVAHRERNSDIFTKTT